MSERTATNLSLKEAAGLMAKETLSEHEAEMLLADAIERGILPANVRRWATEQWDGPELPGNLSRLETFIERADLEAWLAGRH